MLYKRSGKPEEDEIVLCKVTKLFPNSVFVDLLEYTHEAGMVHISEVSPGRIRNLRDFVSIDRQIVCKVLRVDQKTGHIDLSLRRVNTHQKKEKLDEIKQELKAESLILNLAKKFNRPGEQLYKEITVQVFKEYSHLYLFFKDLVAGDADAEKMGLDKKIAQELTQAVLDKFKPQKIAIQGELQLKTYDPQGVEKIKIILQRIGQVSPQISLIYLGAGRYKLVIEDVDYKPAEKRLEQVQELLATFADKRSTADFFREEK